MGTNELGAFSKYCLDSGMVEKRTMFRKRFIPSLDRSVYSAHCTLFPVFFGPNFEFRDRTLVKNMKNYQVGKKFTHKLADH